MRVEIIKNFSTASKNHKKGTILNNVLPSFAYEWIDRKWAKEVKEKKEQDSEGLKIIKKTIKEKQNGSNSI